MLRLVGVDCATKDAKIGLARALMDGGRVTLECARICGAGESAADTIARWIGSAPALPTLLAIDAPLGWPAPLARALVEHGAGEEIAASPDAMFRRTTDHFIRRELGKVPLDVGADRIARTAHAALAILGKLRRSLRDPIPLAWSPGAPDRLAAIEVYPAATLVAHGMRSEGYKERKDVDARREIADRPGDEIDLAVDRPVVEDKADALDAVVCVVAAKNFLLAHREGWIWASRQRTPSRVAA